MPVAAALVVGALVVAGLVRAFLVAPVSVTSASMEPTLAAGAQVWVTRRTPDPDNLARGQLVVFEQPAVGGLTLKRVVGLPGEVLVVLDGVLHVDGVAVDEPWVDPETVDGSFTRTFRVPPRHVFVMGDNRGNSIDSRDYGSIGTEELRGTVLARLWPPWRFAEPY